MGGSGAEELELGWRDIARAGEQDFSSNSTARFAANAGTGKLASISAQISRHCLKLQNQVQLSTSLRPAWIIHCLRCDATTLLGVNLDLPFASEQAGGIIRP
jgi:hypothetical protein